MNSFCINGREISAGRPVYVIAELSGNHQQSFDHAVKLVQAAHEAGADAIKLQTYTADTITLDSDREEFQIRGGLWDGRSLYELYEEAHTPWEWQPKLKAVADDLGVDLFSSPFDHTAVDFLEKMNVPAYKIASFENADLPLLRKVASTGKPVIMSTGMASLAEMDESVKTLREAGCEQLALLKCTSAYPAPPEAANLRTIPHLAEAFDVVAGLSDHVLDNSVAIASVALGASIIEKHFTLSRADGGPDAAFSLEPDELRQLVRSVRIAEKALGKVNYTITEKERASRVFRRSLFVVQDMRAGEEFTHANVRCIRPGHGLAPKYLNHVIGCRAAKDVERGTPVSWDLALPNERASSES